MRNYFIKTPWWLKKFYPSRLWSIDDDSKTIYLSFDDGPHPLATPFVLNELKKYNARATFFCIGKNVVAEPAIYQRILDEGHAVGNHTQDHLNGWKTANDIYLANIKEASKHIRSNLFRPPYGRLRSSQAKRLNDLKIVMWDVLSGDFDESLSREQCLANVINRTKAGSILVFHDSQKAWERLKFCLPSILEQFSRQGYSFSVIS